MVARTSAPTKARSRFPRAGSRAGFTTLTDDKWRELGVLDLDELWANERSPRAKYTKRSWLGEAGVDGSSRTRSRRLTCRRALTFLSFGHWAVYVVFTNANDDLDGSAADCVGRGYGDGREGHHDRAGVL